MNFESSISRREFIALSLSTLSVMVLGGCGKADGAKQAAEKYTRLTIISDLHVPSPRDEEKRKVLRDINGWDDVTKVVALGDMVYRRGIEEEMKASAQLLSILQKPRIVVAGNHDFLYEDYYSEGEKLVRANPAKRAAKLKSFMEHFKIEKLYHSEDLSGYHLIYLSLNDVNGKSSVGLDEAEQSWLAKDLSENRGKPTIIFCHAPLDGTAGSINKKKWFNQVVQPSEKIMNILLENPQVKLWVAGHLHRGAYYPACTDERQYTNTQTGIKGINNPSLKGEGKWQPPKEGEKTSHKYPTLWTNSLYLYPDRVVVKTYDHGKGQELKELEKTIVIK